MAGVAVASGGAKHTIQEAFNDPGIATDRRTAKAVATPAFVLKIKDCA
jgi:hypothetical protein